MTTFKLRSYIVEYFETDIEADSEEQAKEKFNDKFDAGEVECETCSEPAFEGTEEYEVIDSFFNDEE